MYPQERHVYPRGLLCPWAITIKIKLSVLFLYKVDIIILSNVTCSCWFSFFIWHFFLNHSQSLIYYTKEIVHSSTWNDWENISILATGCFKLCCTLNCRLLYLNNCITIWFNNLNNIHCRKTVKFQKLCGWKTPDIADGNI